MKSYSGKPEGYVLHRKLDLLKDRKAFIWLNILSFVVIIPFFFGFWTFDYSTLGDFGAFFILPVFGIVIALHEWIHGVFFHRFSGKKVKYQFHGWAFSASTPGITYQKKYYLIIGLAPAVILNLLLMFFTLLLPEPFSIISYLVLAGHISGCVGDFYVTALLLKYPKDTYVEDTGTGMDFYIKEPNEIIINTQE